MEFGIYGLVPTAVVIVLALWTHRTIECLLAGVIVGLFMVAPSQPLALMAEISLEVMMNETVGWVILVCGFMGSLIALFIRTGAVSAFTESVITRVHTKKGGLFTAWLLGLFLFVDGYLNSIAVGAAMRKAEERAATGLTVPPGAEHIEASNQSILPMALLAVSTWYFDYDFLMGIYLTLTVYVLMIVIRRTLTVDETYNAVLDGFQIHA